MATLCGNATPHHSSSCACLHRHMSGLFNPGPTALSARSSLISFICDVTLMASTAQTPNIGWILCWPNLHPAKQLNPLIAVHTNHWKSSSRVKRVGFYTSTLLVPTRVPRHLWGSSRSLVSRFYCMAFACSLSWLFNAPKCDVASELLRWHYYMAVRICATMRTTTPTIWLRTWSTLARAMTGSFAGKMLQTPSHYPDAPPFTRNYLRTTYRIYTIVSRHILLKLEILSWRSTYNQNWNYTASQHFFLLTCNFFEGLTYNRVNLHSCKYGRLGFLARLVSTRSVSCFNKSSILFVC